MKREKKIKKYRKQRALTELLLNQLSLVVNIIDCKEGNDKAAPASSQLESACPPRLIIRVYSAQKYRRSVDVNGHNETRIPRNK